MNISKKVLICLVLVLFLASCRMNEVQDVTSSASTDSGETEESMPQSADTSAASQQTTNIQSEPTAEQSESEPPETDPVVLSPLELPDDFYESISLPKIEDFSGTEYEDYEYTFGPVESAVLKHNGTEIEISPDDPRLIRLLNFIMYGNQERQTYWRQGYVLEDEINEYLSSSAPMLTVNFDNSLFSSRDTYSRTPQIIISGNQYLIFVDEDSAKEHGEKVMADQHFAYEGLFQKEAEQSIKDKLDKISLEEQWSNPDYYWLDLIEYAGFIVE